MATIFCNASTDREPSELISGFLNGVPSLTEELITLYYKRIYFNCLKMLRDETAAEDATQETFIRAIKYKSSYDKKFRFIFWLLKISTNFCLDSLKKSGRENKMSVRIESLDTDAKNISGLRGLLVDKKAQMQIDDLAGSEMIKGAIDLLPVAYRVTVSLRYYNELSYEEIAQILNKPVGTIKFRMSRAKRLLEWLLAFLYE